MSNSVDIRSRDEVKITAPLEVVNMWSTVSNLLESYVPSAEGEEQGACVEEIPIYEVDSGVLYKIIEYCEKYLEHSKVETEDELKEWKKEFFKNTHGSETLEDVRAYHRELVDLASAVDYLEVPPFLEDITKVIADTIKGKAPETIRDEWEIPDDLTSEEKEQIIRDHRWAFDL